MSTHSAVIDKVHKLLRLSKSSNAHEAANAAARAQELIDRHHLSQAMLEFETAATPRPDEPIQDFGKAGAPLDESGRRDRWAVHLASVIARANGARIYLLGARVQLVGRPSDADTVRYLYAYLVSEVDRLAAASGAGMGRTWRNNFRLGVVDTVSRRLSEQRRATYQAVRDEAPNPAALVHVQAAIATVEKRAADVAAWMKQNMKLRAGRSSAVRYDSGAREQGRRAGEGVRLGGGARLEQGRRMLNGGA